MSRLEHQITDIMNAMYDSINNDNFVFQTILIEFQVWLIMIMIEMTKTNDDMPYDKDNDDMPYDKDNDDTPDDNDNDQMPNKYANDNETAITKVKYDRNMTNYELKDRHKRHGIIQKR